MFWETCYSQQLEYSLKKMKKFFFKMLRSKDFPDECKDFQISSSFLQWKVIWKWYSVKSSFVYTSFALLKTLLRFIIFLWLIIGKTNQTTVSKGNNIFQCKLAVSMNIWTWLQSKWLLCKFSFEFHTFPTAIDHHTSKRFKIKMYRRFSFLKCYFLQIGVSALPFPSGV